MALLIVLSVAAPSCSERSPDDIGHAGHADLDKLFERLQTTSNAEEAEMIEVAIIHAWSESGREEVDRLMLQGLQAIHANDVDGAIRAFDQVVSLAPHFAEGWNMRALVHWLQDEYGPAVSDLRNVLSLEPRHFGALNLLGRIFHEVGDDQTAVRVFEKVLEINPHLEEAQRRMEELREQVAGLPV